MTAPVISTYGWLGRTAIEPLLAEVAAAGVTTVELLAAPPHVDLEEVDAARRAVTVAARASGVGFNSVVPSGVDVNLASTQAGMRRWSVDQFVAAARLAGALDAPYVVVHPGRRHPLRPPPLDRLRGWVIEGLAKIVDAADEAGVQVLVENVPTGLIDSAQECLDLAHDLEGRVALCYDVANGHMVEEVTAGLRVAGPMLQLVHLSDTTRDRWLHAPIGDGDVPFAAISETLYDVDYSGACVFETLHDGAVADAVSADRAALAGYGWYRPGEST